MYEENIVCSFDTELGSSYIIKEDGVVRYKKVDKTTHDNPKNIYYADSAVTEEKFRELHDNRDCHYYIVDHKEDNNTATFYFYKRDAQPIGRCSVQRRPELGSTPLDMFINVKGIGDPKNDQFHYGHKIVKIK